MICHTELLTNLYPVYHVLEYTSVYNVMHIYSGSYTFGYMNDRSFKPFPLPLSLQYIISPPSSPTPLPADLELHAGGHHDGSEGERVRADGGHHDGWHAGVDHTGAGSHRVRGAARGRADDQTCRATLCVRR